jgi:hypothetical protein
LTVFVVIIIIASIMPGVVEIARHRLRARQ